MTFRRILGLPPAPDATGAPAAPGRGADPDTATVRRIAAELEALPPERGRYLAGFAYILSRAAHADLEISADETRQMERVVMEFGGLPEPQAVLVVEIAKAQARQHGATEDYLVTREFAAHATPEEKLALVRCCFAVGAADTSISSEEYAELGQIAVELGIDRAQLTAIRSEFRDTFSAIQAMRRAAEG